MCPSSRRTQPSIAHSSGGCGGATGPLAACEPNPNADKTVLNNPPMPVVTAAAGELTRVDVGVDCGTIAANVETANEAAESVSAAIRIPSFVSSSSVCVDVTTVCDAVLVCGCDVSTSSVRELSSCPLRVSDVPSVWSAVSSTPSGVFDSDDSSPLSVDSLSS